jgi:hypothetical protein
MEGHLRNSSRSRCVLQVDTHFLQCDEEVDGSNLAWAAIASLLDDARGWKLQRTLEANVRFRRHSGQAGVLCDGAKDGFSSAAGDFWRRRRRESGAVAGPGRRGRAQLRIVKWA